MLRTRVTEFFGTRLPIVASGLQWLANADYAAAASRAGLMGFLTAASFPELSDLRDEIRRCRDLCEGGPFGVNVSMLPKLVEGDRTEAVFDLIAGEGVRFVETSGRNPESYLPRLRAAGIKVVHKVPTVKHARKAQAVGVDMVEVIGAEAGGHPGMELVGTIVQATLAAREITVPLVVGGGIGTGEQLVAALALGADGVLMGTRFLVAEELCAHPGYKTRLVEARETDTTLVMQSLRNTLRALRNETTERIQEVEKEKPGDLSALMPLISGKLGRQAYETGDMRLGALSLGQSVVFADRVEPFAAIVARIEAEAEQALERLRRLGG
ncbi:nitronate monooxygenase [Azospirillum sp. TSO22-1]|uniref:NAD(P)H-dependent flavin oxidoreductase n=1 Tax=Azospirillum sp. TSO22-1 TaxID=716789 RepID=UPI000D61F757|nr:nitronate monooxygenase [Azospirillum sp. TSO22-1]PWC44765.1 2-nitropropane dioxygenase [Azospirillum sp. TSO22-1]